MIPLANHGSLVGMGRQTAMVDYNYTLQQAVQRAEWEAQDLDAETERDRKWAAAYLPLDLI